jgi:hypothetical protein
MAESLIAAYMPVYGQQAVLGRGEGETCEGWKRHTGSYLNDFTNRCIYA